MKTLSKKRLATALGLALAAGSFLPSAQAVNLATDGLGQALIFPHYTVQAGWDTLFNVTNTSNLVVVAKVAFHESYNSRPVFDFNIILSPKDVWNGWVSLRASDGMPVFTTVDRTCAAPQFQFPRVGQASTPVPFEPNPAAPVRGMLAYTGNAADSGPTDIARMQNGYVTVIMMGAADPAVSTLAAFAVHNTNTGIPLDCGRLDAAFGSPAGLGVLQAAFPLYSVNPLQPDRAGAPSPLNPLKGMYSFVNAAQGQNAGGSPVTLANFRNAPIMTLQLPPGAIQAPNAVAAFAASFHEPSLNAANTPAQVLDVTDTLQPAPPAFDPNYFGSDQISWLLLRDSIVNHWMRNTTGNGWTTNTDWAITFPTKRFYVDDPTQSNPLSPIGAANPYAAINAFRGHPRVAPPAPLLATSPFATFFGANRGLPGTACNPLYAEIYDREERGGPVSIYSPGILVNQICYESNVLTFNGSNVLGAPQRAGAPIIQNLPGNNGWAQLFLASSANTLDGNPVTPTNPGFGLPVVGFSIATRTTPSSQLLNEGYIIDHSYTRRNPFAPQQRE